MFDKIRSSFLTTSDTHKYDYLPDEIRDEIRAANEATSVYDIP